MRAERKPVDANAALEVELSVDLSAEHAKVYAPLFKSDRCDCIICSSSNLILGALLMLGPGSLISRCSWGPIACECQRIA